MATTYRIRATRTTPDGRREDVSSWETLGDAHGIKYREHGLAIDIALALDATRDDFDVPANVRYEVEKVS